MRVHKVLVDGAVVVVLEWASELIILAVEWNHQHEFVGMALEQLFDVVDCFLLRSQNFIWL